MAAKPNRKTIDTIAKAGRVVRFEREKALSKIEGGLRAIYRLLELPGKSPLKNAHAALDRAVLAAYGFDPDEDILRQILELNHEVAMRIELGHPVTSPGIPTDYPDPDSLITDDCLRPPQVRS